MSTVLPGVIAIMLHKYQKGSNKYILYETLDLDGHDLVLLPGGVGMMKTLLVVMHVWLWERFTAYKTQSTR